MIEVGIFAKIFQRPTLAETLDAVQILRVRSVQFNMARAGLTTLPSHSDPTLCEEICREFQQRGLTMTAISGTFNIIDPNRQHRLANIGRFRLLASMAPLLGTNVITISTGTRHPTDMWAKHAENHLPATWKEMMVSLETLATIAQGNDIMLAFEPEQSNVVNSAEKAKSVLKQLNSSHVGVLLDPANLLSEANLHDRATVIARAFDLIGENIALAHAKDIRADARAGDCTPGQGILNFKDYFERLAASGYGLPVIAHGFTESEAPASLDYLRSLI